MNIQEQIYNKIQEMELDLPLNVPKSKYIYTNNTLQEVQNDYVSNSSNEIIFIYTKINGQNFIEIK